MENKEIKATWTHDGFECPDIEGIIPGVYCIYDSCDKNEDKYITIKVGSSQDLNQRFGNLINDDKIKEHEPMFVAWIEVRDEKERAGIEKFLGETLKPLVPGDDARFPDVDPIPVNLPYDPQI